MHRTSLEIFKYQINQIREYLNHIDYVDIIIKENLQIDLIAEGSVKALAQHDHKFRTDRRIFEYKSLIISLYGLLENTIETWVKEYLNSLSKVVTNYNCIEERIRDRHFELSLKLISIISTRENAKFQNLSKETILKNLNNCVDNKKNFTINVEAFLVPSGNLKHAKIVEIFKNIGLSLNNIFQKNDELMNYIEAELQIHGASGHKPEILYKILDDLVDKRNMIAHGSELLDEIQDKSFVEQYIRFIENYCTALFLSLEEKYLKLESESLFSLIEGEIKIFRNKYLLFDLVNYRIRLGDKVIICAPNDRYFAKTIQSIQVDNKPVKTFYSAQIKKVSIGLDPKILEAQQFFLKKRN